MDLKNALAARSKDVEVATDVFMTDGFSTRDYALDEISRYFDDCEGWGRGAWARALSQVTLERDEVPELYEAMIALGNAKGWA